MAILSIVFTPSISVPSSGYTVYYKKAGSVDPYSTVTGLTSPINITVPSTIYNYEGFIRANCAYAPSINVPFLTSTYVPDLAWIAYATVCEKDNQFAVSKTITGLSSPANIWYDIVTTKMFVADYDDINGNVYWFNPTTATTYADMIHSAQVTDQYLYSNYIDSVKRKIYFTGKNSGGLIVYDIDTNTKITVAFGTNGINSSRVNIQVSGNNIYVNDRANNRIIIIDRTTLIITGSILIPTIPNYARFSVGSFTLFIIGSEIWVIAGAGSSVSTIGIYDLTFTTNIANITLPGALLWTYGVYQQSGFYDSTSGHFYISDIGSNIRYVVDVATKTILNTQTSFNRSNKSNSYFSWTVNPINNQLYASFTALNTSSDTVLKTKLYIENRSTYTYEKMYDSISVTNLKSIAGTNTVIGVASGGLFWNGGSYSTDGIISFLDSSISGSSTGMSIVTSLQEIDHNNSNIPTGNRKPNLMTDVNYIAPVINLTACPVTYNYNCPLAIIYTNLSTILEYEITIPTSVKSNPAVDKVAVYSKIVGGAVVGTPIIVTAPFTSNYFSGTFTGLTVGTVYQPQIKYLDISNNILNTCL